MKIDFILNGRPVAADPPDGLTLLNLLRDHFGLTGTKSGCGIGVCGSCAVLIDGQAINACQHPAAEVNGCTIVTIEGIHGPDGGLSAVQQAFLDYGAVQCGYCTPGMVIAAEALLLHNPSPTREEIRAAIAGNLCRCTGYQQIIDAVEAAAQSIARQRKKTP